jgi:hypothetical protein
MFSQETVGQSWQVQIWTKPGTKNGPRSFAWFATVVQELLQQAGRALGGSKSNQVRRVGKPE